MSPSWAKLPPNVQDIFPPDKTVIAKDSEFWLYGPTLTSFNFEEISLRDSQGEAVECDVKAYPVNDYTEFHFDGDFRGVAGDSGELELIIVEPKAPLQAGHDYVLSTENRQASYHVDAQATKSAPAAPRLLKAEKSAPRGHDFDGETLYSTTVSFTLADPKFAGRIEILDEQANLLAFALSTAAEYRNDHLELTTRLDSRKIKLRLVDYQGQTSPSSAAVEVSAEARERSYVIGFASVGVLALLGLGLVTWLRKS